MVSSPPSSSKNVPQSGSNVTRHWNVPPHKTELHVVPRREDAVLEEKWLCCVCVSSVCARVCATLCCALFAHATQIHSHSFVSFIHSLRRKGTCACASCSECRAVTVRHVECTRRALASCMCRLHVLYCAALCVAPRRASHCGACGRRPFPRVENTARQRSLGEAWTH